MLRYTKLDDDETDYNIFSLNLEKYNDNSFRTLISYNTSKTTSLNKEYSNLNLMSNDNTFKISLNINETFGRGDRENNNLGYNKDEERIALFISENPNIKITNLKLINREKIDNIDVIKSKNEELINYYSIPCENILLNHYYIKDYSGNNKSY